jgi:hypothetical protein
MGNCIFLLEVYNKNRGFLTAFTSEYTTPLKARDARWYYRRVSSKGCTLVLQKDKQQGMHAGATEG